MAPVVLRIPAGVHVEARHLAITSSVGMATRSCCILRRSYIGPRYELTKRLGSLKRGLRAELGEVVKSGVDVAVSVGHSALCRRGTCTEGNLPKRELNRGVGVAPVSDCRWRYHLQRSHSTWRVCTLENCTASSSRVRKEVPNWPNRRRCCCHTAKRESQRH